MAITQLPPAPQRLTPADFVQKADDHVASLTQFVTETNAEIIIINNNAISASNSAASAEASASVAESISNFKGDWSILAGALNVPSSVRHNDTFWQLLNNLVDVTLSEPGITGDWQAIFNGNNVNYTELNNPILHILKKNKQADTLAGTFTTLRSTIATFVGRYGIVKTSSIDTIREESIGYLLEGTSTNLILFSEELDNAVWTKIVIGSSTAPIVTPNFAIGPDGNMTAARVQFSIASDDIANRSLLRQLITTTANANLSVYFKRNTGVDQQIHLDTRGSTSTALVVTDKWTRFNSTQFDFGENSSWGIELRGGTGGTDLTSDILVALVSVVEHEFPTSYIKTTTAAATRTSDLVSVQVNGNFISQTQGDHTQTFTFTPLGRDGDTRLYTALSVLGQSFRYLLGLEADGSVSYRDGGEFAIDTGATVFGITSKIAFVTENGVMKTYLNGEFVESVANTVLDELDPDNILYIGHSNGLFNYYGHMLGFKVYDFALNPDQIRFL